MVIEGKELTGALHVPRQAVFEKAGKNHVFVKVGDRFEQREVKVTQRTESRVVRRRAARKDARSPSSIRPLRADRPAGQSTPRRCRRPRRAMSSSRIPAVGRYADFLPDLRMGLDNLRAHKLRSLLTMLGMIFGVAAVVAMLSIGAGAQQEVMAFIEQLGVRNLIVEAREAPD